MYDNKLEMIVDAVSQLQNRGFTFDFNLLNGKLFCAQLKSFIHKEQFSIVEVHAFESEQSRDDEMVLYGIEWLTTGIKGILVYNQPAITNDLTCKLKSLWK